MGAPADLAIVDPPRVAVPDPDNSPVLELKPEELKRLGEKLNSLFSQYKSDRRIAELKWLRNLRQYLGLYDPEIEKELSANRSKAYPRITRVKCISILSRLMNLMFQGSERNWEIKASPSPDMSVEDVKEAIAKAQEEDQEAGIQQEMDIDYVMNAVQTLADSRAVDLSRYIDDQLQELGGDQTLDYVALNRKVINSGILYGLGVLRGPYVREQHKAVWSLDSMGQPQVKKRKVYKPMFEFLSIWDFYPDMSAKTLYSMDGYFTRVVMSRSQVRALADRPDFFKDQIKNWLSRNSQGNYRPQPFETELRAMGVKVNVNEMKAETMKYEIVVWHGPISGEFLMAAGVSVPDSKKADEIDAEVWLIDGNVIKADINPWRKLGVDVSTVHTFLFDEDDTSPVGNGLPNVIRDSQMSLAAATRMLLDNASVTCGPNIEVNTDLLRPDQDLANISAYKIWYREGDGPEAQWPAVRPVVVDGHMDELLKVIDLFMKFADTETFVNPATGGDQEKMPSEPMRTAAGASMLRGDAALPFKDIVRSFDQFTQSVIQSIVKFNQKFNPDDAPEADFNIIARGATSLIAKEVRGMQMDQLAQTLRPEDLVHINDRKFIEARFAIRDMQDFLVSEDEAKRRQKAQDDQNSKMQQMQIEQAEAEKRKTLADAFKGITQGQKNTASAQAEQVGAALTVLEKGLQNELGTNVQPAPGGGGAGEGADAVSGDAAGGADQADSGDQAGGAEGNAPDGGSGAGGQPAGPGPGMV
jgi:hypothetical protein